MRVITGTARGRVLKELEGLETRPTTCSVGEEPGKNIIAPFAAAGLFDHIGNDAHIGLSLPVLIKFGFPKSTDRAESLLPHRISAPTH